MGVLKWGCAAVFLACVVLIVLHPWGGAFALGVHPYPAGTPWTYQLWSGFLPSLAIVSIFTGIGAHFKMLNCHVHGCWHIGKFPMAGGKFKVCHKHSDHPRKITHAYILAKHEEHARCAGQLPSS